MEVERVNDQSWGVFSRKKGGANRKAGARNLKASGCKKHRKSHRKPANRIGGNRGTGNKTRGNRTMGNRTAGHRTGTYYAGVQHQMWGPLSLGPCGCGRRHDHSVTEVIDE